MRELSEQQALVLSGIKRGLSNKLIAREHGMTVKAVEGLVERLLKNLGVKSRVQAVVKVYEMEKQ